MANVRVRWIDSISVEATGNKIYRDDVFLADVGLGIQEYIDNTADGNTTYKYEVQATGPDGTTTQETIGVNVDNITTQEVAVAPTIIGIVVEDAAPNNVVMTFDKDVTGTNLGFTVGGTTSNVFASISGAGTTWTGVLADEVAFGESVTLSYDSVTGDFEDTVDNIALASFSNEPVTNNVAEAPAIPAIAELELNSPTGSLYYLPTGDSEYSVDGGSTWTPATSGVQVDVVASNVNCYIRQASGGTAVTALNFTGMTSLLNVLKCDTGQTDYFRMWYNCSNLESISGFVTTGGTNFREAFRSCSSLLTIPTMDLSACTSLRTTFMACTSLTNVDNLDASNPTDLRQLFQGCTSLLTISNLDTAGSTLFEAMFSGCSALQTISCLDTTSGSDMTDMFLSCTSLTDPDSGEQAALIAAGGATTCP